MTISTPPPSSPPSRPHAGTGAPAGSKSFGRRTFLSYLGAVGLGAAAASRIDLVPYRAVDAGRAVPSGVQHQWAMVFDLRYCDGCKACTLACQERHYLPPEQTWINVFPMEDAAGRTYHMPRPCMMCENPPCVQVCPVGANIRTDEGLVLVDQSRCIGTRICMNACPYQARYFNWSAPRAVPKLPMPATPEWPVPQQQGTVGKCVLCADRLPHGELPACVAGCPMGAIYVGDLVSDVAVNG
ncbi:MAG TPA: 4Fe-4S dicluster domain-containing protein, partial [Candidatus Dormibacteraeota bacterium]|nr:4Fe-4S dicluster domain-containing protein [Candidatus Dormibacteraeota bacterium]